MKNLKFALAAALMFPAAAASAAPRGLAAYCAEQATLAATIMTMRQGGAYPSEIFASVIALDDENLRVTGIAITDWALAYEIYQTRRTQNRATVAFTDEVFGTCMHGDDDSGKRAM